MVIPYLDEGNAAFLEEFKKGIRHDKDIIGETSHLAPPRQEHEALVQMLFLECDDWHFKPPFLLEDTREYPWRQTWEATAVSVPPDPLL
jgi:hypothetical protein